MTSSTCPAAGRCYAPARGPVPQRLRTGRRARGWAAAVARLVERLRVALSTWQRRRADFLAYAELSDAMLHDIGTSRSEIEAWSAEADGRAHVANARAHLSFFLKL